MAMTVKSGRWSDPTVWDTGVVPGAGAMAHIKAPHQIIYDREADVILVAVSRAGKTPTCVYLALHHGVRAANYPLTEEDLDSDRLPAKLRPFKSRLFGLTIDPDRLAMIRQERRPNSRYAQLETCRREVAAAEAMFRAERISTLSTTHTSIEEIASKVMSTLGIQREMF